VEPDRPWVGTEPPVTSVDRQLFRASIVVNLGNGEKASFWQSSWLQGQGTNGPVPRPFQTWKKNHTVKEELEHQSWTRGLWRMESISEMVSFTRLWDLVQNVHLTDVQDSITWKSNGEYTAKSAYQIFFS